MELFSKSHVQLITVNTKSPETVGNMKKSENEKPGLTNEEEVRQKKIGARLKRMYDEVVEEDIPDDFLSLLESIDNAKDEHNND